MIVSTILLLGGIFAGSSPLEGGHSQNPVYKELSDGIKAERLAIQLPPPTLPDVSALDEEKLALESIADLTKLSYDEFIRDSISAPFVLKTRDDASNAETVLRHADLYFVVRGELEAVDLSKVLGDSSKAETIESGNMKFKSSGVPADSLAKAKVDVPGNSESERFVHQTSHLFGRIVVDETDRVTSSSEPRSILVAGRTDPRFDDSADFPNRWSPVEKSGGKEVVGKPSRFLGTFGYVKATKLTTVDDAILVEVHFVYAEPKAWFNGGPILKSKFGAVAQDRIRALRRELLKARQKSSAAKSK